MKRIHLVNIYVTVSVTEDLTAEEIIDYIESELENANHHSMTDFPGVLFNAIVNEFELSEEQQVKLARILSEGFEQLY